MLSCLLISSVTVGSIPASAKDDELLGYAVSAVLPSTQLDKEKTYFYVQTVPGEVQTLEVKVQSTREEPVKLKVAVKDASSESNGEIAYRTPDDKDMHYDETLKEPVSSMIEIEEPEFTVTNFEEKIVRLKVTPPKEHYQGAKLGAVSIGLSDMEEKKGVKTGFAYDVGIIFSETGEEFNNSSSLELKSAKAALKNGKKRVLANLQNPEPKVLENLTISAVMKNKSDGKVIKERKAQAYSMAPNSNFDFDLDWGIANLASGVYILEMDVNNDFNNWSFKKEFTITNKQAAKINAESPYRIITPIKVQIVSIVLGVLTSIVIVLQFTRRKKWEKQWRKLKISRKKKTKNKKGKREMNKK